MCIFDFLEKLLRQKGEKKMVKKKGGDSYGKT